MSGKRQGPISDKQRTHLNRLAEERKRHGLCDHPLYAVYWSMLGRCTNPSLKSYKDYGERGIAVCEEWAEDFAAFFGWAVNSGWQRGLHIDRIDTNGNYEPGNCRWTNRQVNNQNRRNTLTTEKVRSIYAAGGSHAEASRQSGVPYTVAAKIRRGQTYRNITQGEPS